MERGEAVSVSNQSQAQPIKGKSRPVKARQLDVKASEGITKDDLSNYRRGEAQGEAAVLVVDEPETAQGKAGKATAKTSVSLVKQAQLVEAVVDGATVSQAAVEAGVGYWSARRVLAASGEHMQALQKDLLDGKFKLSKVADQELLRRLMSNPERLSASDLSILSGVATQRALELAKVPGKEAPPDWSGLAGWAGSDAEDEPVKE